MAAMALAGFGAGGGMASGKSLTCGVCQDVYRSPRFLPCFHTFCLYCLEELDKAHDRQPFPCPSCRAPTTLPRPDGALGLKVNFYMTPEELQQARESPGTTPCRHPGHDGQALLLYCQQCQEILCMVCKVTAHEQHAVKALVEVAARCQQQLGGQMRGRLDDAIRFLTERSARANDSLQAAKEDGERMKEKVQAQHAILVAKAPICRDAALHEVEKSIMAMKEKLSADAFRIQRELDSLLQLGQRVQRAMGDASDAEKVEVEREMREGRGSETSLQKVKDELPDTTVRPGLHFDLATLTDDVIRRFLGSPLELGLPGEVLVPVYRCGLQGECRQVNSLAYHGDTLFVRFGETSREYFEGARSIKLDGKPLKETDLPVFRNTSLGQKSHHHPYIKSHGCKGDYLSELNGLGDQVIAFDYFDFEFGQLLVVLEKKKPEQANVLLFHSGCRKPFAMYNPANADFRPADVCFWSEGGEVKLLVADRHNGSVHVVRLFATGCRFERYLQTEGSAPLVEPMTLYVHKSGVWVGCGDGWILRADPSRQQDERGAGGAGKLASVAGSSAGLPAHSDDRCASSCSSSDCHHLRVDNTDDPIASLVGSSEGPLTVDNASESTDGPIASLVSNSEGPLTVDNASESTDGPIASLVSSSEGPLTVDNASESTDGPIASFVSSSEGPLTVDNASESTDGPIASFVGSSVGPLTVDNASEPTDDPIASLFGNSASPLILDNASQPIDDQTASLLGGSDSHSTDEQSASVSGSLSSDYQSASLSGSSAGLLEVENASQPTDLAQSAPVSARLAVPLAQSAPVSARLAVPLAQSAPVSAILAVPLAQSAPVSARLAVPLAQSAPVSARSGVRLSPTAPAFVSSTSSLVQGKRVFASSAGPPLEVANTSQPTDSQTGRSEGRYRHHNGAAEPDVWKDLDGVFSTIKLDQSDQGTKERRHLD